MSATNKVVSIADHRHLGSLVAPDLERARRALSGKFNNLVARGIAADVESYLACDARGETVHLNVLSASATSDVRARELFVNEVEAAAKLTHPNIIATSEHDEILGVHFCVVEQKRHARTLHEVLAYEGWLDVVTASEIADQIASALDYAHQVGVVHLRLDTESVLIEPDGWVSVASFGTRAERPHRSKNYRAQYAGPEVVAGTAVDHRGDLYSLGAVLYEMLTDRTPYDSDDPEHIKQKQTSDVPSPPHLISADVPESVSAVVMKLLELDPDNRFGSAAEFQAALDAASNQF
jgi:eukaryotic-like serine/threonine-protein kinase